MPKTEPTLAEATEMTFACDDLWKAIKRMPVEDLVRWWNAETHVERRIILASLANVRKAMR